MEAVPDTQSAVASWPDARLTINLPLSVNSRYGEAELKAVTDALYDQRTAYQTNFLECLRCDDTKGAYNYWQDIHQIDHMLNEIMTQLIELADNNYASHRDQANSIGGTKKDNEERYEQFLISLQA